MLDADCPLRSAILLIHVHVCTHIRICIDIRIVSVLANTGVYTHAAVDDVVIPELLTYLLYFSFGIVRS